MTRHDSGTTRRNVLRVAGGAAGALLGGVLAIDTADRAGADDREPTDDVADAEAYAEDETVRATVDRIDAEAQVLVLHTYDGREVTGSPDVYDIREGDVVDARLRAGRVVGVTRLEAETEERRDEMRERFDELASEGEGQ